MLSRRLHVEFFKLGVIVEPSPSSQGGEDVRHSRRDSKQSARCAAHRALWHSTAQNVGNTPCGRAWLLREYHRHGDLGARSRLIQQYLPLVRRLARRHVGHGEQFEDLVQVGSIGLIKAIDRFQLERGVDLATYAIPTIDGEIKRHLRDRAWPIRIPRRLQELDPTLRARVAELVDGENGEFDRDSALERGYELGEDRIALASGFHVLDARERLLLRLAYFEG